MDILVLGGTRFVGRTIVETALARNHRVTILHRGNTGPDLFQNKVETILADRLGPLDRLAGRTWDACIDTCAYFPRAVNHAADALAGSIAHYALISTISVYDHPQPGSDENAAVFEQGDPDNEEVTGESYGYLKVLCERAAIERFGVQSLIVRPGIVVGPNDHTDRFTYWPVRISQEPRVIVPGGPDRPLQWIDARDLAAFVVDGVEQQHAGIYHCVGPARPTTLRETLKSIRDHLNPSCQLVDVDLEAAKIEPWTDLPLVVEPEDGLMRLSPARAMHAGLRYRPLAQTIDDLLTWWKAENRELRAGMPAERHREILEAHG